MPNIDSAYDLKHLADYKAYLHEAYAHAKASFIATGDARMIVTDRAQQLDKLLRQIWVNSELDNSELALLAVGGYGRGELHPYSDIDIAIVLNREPDKNTETLLQLFVTTLWDLGLDIGHSVRTVAQTFEAARSDITVMTNLLESRLIAGSESLFIEINSVVRSENLWTTKDFFAEKSQEQKARYRKFDDALQHLEPNVKESPGGL